MSSSDVTLLLQRIRGGDHTAESQLMSLVYNDLHRMAARQFQSERRGHTLQPTALISELYLRLLRDASIDWQSRAHFFSVAASTIRRILIDHARARNAKRRPSPNRRVELDDVFVYTEDRADELLMVNDALDKLRELDERQAKVVELRYFAGLSIDEIGELLHVSERTVKRDWTSARAWLAATINGTLPGE
jgi:RNA polymerase sigma factor (TIGR02999 family)